MPRNARLRGLTVYHDGTELAKPGAILLLKDKPMFADKEGHLAVERVENDSDVWL